MVLTLSGLLLTYVSSPSSVLLFLLYWSGCVCDMGKVFSLWVP